MQMLILQLNKSFTDSEKDLCIPIIRGLIELADLSRRKGILALEMEMHQEQSVFLKTAIGLIVDGTDPVKVKQILQTLILSGNYSGSQLLERLLMTEGVLSMQRGDNPRIMAIQLLAMLGEEYLTQLDETKPEDKVKPYNDLIRSFEGKKASLESVPFEKKLLAFSDRRSIQCILHSLIDWRNLAYALYGCSIELICKILDNVSENQCMYLCGELLRIHSFDQKSSLTEPVLQAQNDILKNIENLEKQGMILALPKFSEYLLP